MSDVPWSIIPTAAHDPAREASEGRRWARLGHSTVVWSGPGRLGLVTQVGAAFLAEHPRFPVVLERGRHLVVDLAAWTGALPARGHDWRLERLPPDSVVLDVPRAPARQLARNADEVVTALDAGRVAADLAHLVGLGTRHSLSAGFASAATWAQDRLAGLGFTAARVPVAIPGGTTANVVAERPGTGGQRRVVVLTAHLDSVNHPGGPSAPAPGADDNASGSVGALELARVFSSVTHRLDLRVILFGGEEQGLHGSRRYVAALPPEERARIAAVLNMDMIGTLSGSPSVLLEGAPVSQTLIDDLAAAAASTTSLAVTTSLNPFASDHVPFIDNGIPAVLTIEGNDSSNTNIHTANDVLDHVTVDYLVTILRMNAAAVAGWLGVEDSGGGGRRPRPAGSVVAWGGGSSTRGAPVSGPRTPPR